MDTGKFTPLLQIAENFGNIARQVNESSKVRRSHAERAIALLADAARLGTGLLPGLERVCETNLELRNRNEQVLSICVGLSENLERQRSILESLQGAPLNPPGWAAEVSAKIEKLDAALDEALPLLHEIIARDNRVHLMERYIIELKKMQIATLGTLRLLSDTSLDDAHKAVSGSEANLARGLRLMKEMRKIPLLVEVGDRGVLEEILEETRRGSLTAQEVNLSSRGQLDFAEKVHQFTKQLHHETEQVIASVREKHEEFDEMIQVVTVLTVVLSLKFPLYLETEEIMEGVAFGALAEKIRELTVWMHIAWDDIRMLAEMNYDMADLTRLNNEHEDRTLRIAERELDCLGDVVQVVDAMNDAVAYPIDGSRNNMDNGRRMEEQMQRILEQL